jgi:4-hydroxy-tetrahydrodipicolinate synthase
MPAGRAPKEERVSASREAICSAFGGPIASVRTPFGRDGRIDYEGLQRMVDFDVEAGAGALLLTWGDSLFSLLEDQEIAALTAAVVRGADGRAVVAACTGRWPTSKAVEFAAFCRKVGADVLQVFPPFWYQGCCAADAILAHHAAIADQMPVMTNSAELQRNGGASQGLELASALLECVGNVQVMKADVTGEYDRRITALVRERWVVFAGGQKSFHMELWPYGCRGYLSTFMTFRPSVTRAYWQAITAGDMQAAARIIDQVDRPFFERILAMPGGFDAALHGIGELTGLSGRWRRPPFYSLSDRDMEELAGFLAALREAEPAPG